MPDAGFDAAASVADLNAESSRLHPQY